ncbi:extra-large guanine nucleotide-binding protein 1-like [Henckelia pumila]|uniref:extra-large guanine nucleotide-binding protein 1-like n=1 Tax=Henckelia pumila TaxID=405737 RepID=UPI003C6DE980
MTSVLRRILPGSSTPESEDHDDEYSVEYSFALEYSGPPISHEIPHVVPLDIHQIPTASVAAKAVIFSNLSLPVIQPIVKGGKKSAHELKSGLEVVGSNGSVLVTSEILSSDEVYRRKSEDGSCREGALGVSPPTSDVLYRDPSTSTSGTTGFLDRHDDSNMFSGDSDVEDFYDDCWASISHENCLQPSIPDSRRLTSSRSRELESCEGEEDCVDETSGQGNRTAVVTFRDLSTSDVASDESDHDEFVKFPEKPVISDDGPKGLCHRCHKRNRFAEKEVCIVCGSKYCSKCVLRAMGSMPEGRKCVSCIGYRIDESKRNSLGKCSRMLKSIITNDAIKQIMTSEISCDANQLPPHLICVNEKPLSIEELLLLQNCLNPPKNLRPGKYWYDRVSGFWGKEGEQPCQIISAELEVGYQIRRTASNGNTNVLINNREVTKAEIWMLKAAGIRCDVNTHFWVAPNGLCQLEGMNNELGNLWEKKRVKFVCSALSLPFPLDSSKPGGSGVAKETDKVNSKNLEPKLMNKLLLVGCDQSGTSTIFKQAKIVYKVHFSEDEKEDMKFLIQRNLYHYLAILLEGNGIFEEEYSIQAKIQCASDPGPSEISDQVVEKNTYSLSPKLKGFASWLLKVTMSGNLEAIFPAATREYSPLVAELWKDKAFQATYRRRNELHMLPTVANYFLDRAVEFSRVDYEPSEMDILHAEGITASNGVASMEFSFPKSSQDEYMETFDQNDPSTSCQLIRVHASNLGENCKWLEMFEDIDLVIYCVSLTDYAEYYEDMSGIRTNKLVVAKNHFETIVTHPTHAGKNFLLILNKFDLLEEKIEQVPLRNCEWFQDFNPVISLHPHSLTSNNNPPLPQRAFHYIAMKFKRLFNSLTGKKLFVSRVTGLEPDSVDKALKYSKEILKWQDEMNKIASAGGSELSSESVEPTSSM